MTEALELLAAEKKLPPKYGDHDLNGDYAGCRKWHITPDWLPIYEISGDNMILYFIRTGTHSDLF